MNHQVTLKSSRTWPTTPRCAVPPGTAPCGSTTLASQEACCSDPLICWQPRRSGASIASAILVTLRWPGTERRRGVCSANYVPQRSPRANPKESPRRLPNPKERQSGVLAQTSALRAEARREASLSEPPWPAATAAGVPQRHRSGGPEQSDTTRRA